MWLKNAKPRRPFRQRRAKNLLFRLEQDRPVDDGRRRDVAHAPSRAEHHQPGKQENAEDHAGRDAADMGFIHDIAPFPEIVRKENGVEANEVPRWPFGISSLGNREAGRRRSG